MQSAAYCRLKNMTISYDLPKAWIEKIHLTKAQVFFSGGKLADLYQAEQYFRSGRSVYSEQLWRCA